MLQEQRITPETTALYFCETENGAANLTTLDVDLFGNIQNWPKDFFGDQFGEMAAMTKAALNRRKAPQE